MGMLVVHGFAGDSQDGVPRLAKLFGDGPPNSLTVSNN